MWDSISGRIHLAAYLGLALGILAALLLIVAGPGFRMGWWQLFTAFGLLRYGAYFGIAAIVVSVIGVAGGRIAGRRGVLVPGLVGLIVGLVAVYVPMQWQGRAQSVPPIHDITTDMSDPPAFDAVAAERGANQNPVAYAGEDVAKQQRAAYPDIGPVESDLPPDQAFAVVRQAVEDTGWAVARVDEGEMIIEATDQTFWFGFKDDIVLRVTPTAGGSEIDMRSQSRIGRSDIGANARRIREFTAALRDRLAG